LRHVQQSFTTKPQPLGNRCGSAPARARQPGRPRERPLPQIFKD